MQIFTKKTGWVSVLRDDVKNLCFWVAVRGYTFYAAGYTEVLAYDDSDSAY